MGKHFYTTDANEATRAIQSGKVLEGIACCVLPVTSNPQPPVVPLLRLYKGSIDDHFYTADPNELSIVTQNGFQQEPAPCFVYDLNQTSVPQGTLPFYRMFTP
jgi:uncharacterized protein DUF5648